MPRESIYSLPHKQVSRTSTVPAPIGGLNARESAAAMPITDAIVMRNFFPFPYAVSLRKGWKEFVVGLAPSDAPTVATYNPTVNAPTVIAFSGGNIYVLIVPGVAPAPLVTGMTNDYWQTTMYNNAGGTYLVCVNGADDPRNYDGTTFTVPVFTPMPVAETLDPKKFVHVCVHQRRLWFVEKDSMQAWFLQPNEISGVATLFPVGQLFRMGGFLMAIYTWTIDAGQGVDDKLAFVSSRGEVAIYSGTDPEDAAKWKMEGIFYVGAPVGRRCGTKYGGDLALVTTNGVTPLSNAFQSTRVNNADNLTDKIQHTISTLISLYKNLIGWEMLMFPDENQAWLIVPVPISTTDPPTQPSGVQVYAMNTITGSWCQYDSMDIRSSDLYGERPVFITRDGRVCRAWEGYFDNVPWDKMIGTRIDAEAVTAYNYFGLLGQTKRWTMVRAIFQSGAVPAGALQIVTDYAIVGPLTLPPPGPASGDFLWDEAIWDAARWDAAYERYRLWRSVDGLGYTAALHLKISQAVQTEWIASDFVFEAGGVL
jgi:hypothetical protein